MSHADFKKMAMSHVLVAYFPHARPHVELERMQCPIKRIPYNPVYKTEQTKVMFCFFFIESEDASYYKNCS